MNAQQATTVLLQIPFDPLIMWMLSPALIRAWTSVVLLDPGITISVYLGKKGPILKFHLDHLIRFKHAEWVHLKCNVFKRDEKKVVFIHTASTCSGDDPLHLDSSFLQKVDRQASGRAGARHAHANLSGHHGDRG